VVPYDGTMNAIDISFEETSAGSVGVMGWSPAGNAVVGNTFITTPQAAKEIAQKAADRGLKVWPECFRQESRPIGATPTGEVEMDGDTKIVYHQTSAQRFMEMIHGNAHSWWLMF